MAKRIGFIGFDGVVALDLIGPMEAFAMAADAAAVEPSPYELVLLGLGSRPFRTTSGVTLVPHRALERARGLDTLIIPGGGGLRTSAIQTPVVAWLRRHAPGIRRVASVCTGIYGLVPSGLLDGRRATTHWRFAADVARRYPAVRMEPDALFVRDGSFYTSAGVTAGIDLSLALIEEDLGPKAAVQLAREMVVYLRRDGGQEQYSEPLRFQAQATDRFAELAAWMVGHLRHDLSIEALARRASLSPRHFHRLFTQSMGKSPATLVEELRLDEARRHLTRPGVSVARAAEAAGFRSADSMRRAFKRRFGLMPSSYAARFEAGRRGAYREA
jgi:transcriptional regulator GlxA family with amidase domain